MQGLEHSGDLMVLQMPANEAGAVPCERIRKSCPGGFIIPVKYGTGSRDYLIDSLNA